MKRSLTTLLCTSRRKNSLNDQLVVMNNSGTEEETMETYRSIVHLNRIHSNHQKIKRSAIFIRAFRVLHQRISNNFHRRTRTTLPPVRRNICLEEDEISENLYATIPWELASTRHTEDTDDLLDYPMTRLIERSPPQITWKHSWSMSETREALLNSPFSTLPTEIAFQIFEFLSVHDLGNVSLVCRRFKMIVDQDEIWRSKCDTSNKLLSKSFKEIYMDWEYEKYLRNIKSYEIECQGRYKCINDLIVQWNSVVSLEKYPVRLQDGIPFSSVAGFKQHPNSSQDMTIELSINIDDIIPELLSLFRKASLFHTQWYQPMVIKQMILRYDRFMKLKALYPTNILLVPTLDIELVWQTHLSYPEMYRTDCLRLFGRVIDHSLLTNNLEQFLKKQAFIDTCQLYKEHFGEQYCPLPIVQEDGSQPLISERNFLASRTQCPIPVYSYWNETSFEFNSQVPHNYENPFSFTELDIIADGNWFNSYNNFMFEMRWKNSNDIESSLLENNTNHNSSVILLLKKSYERFLYMAAKYPRIDGYSFVSLSYAIDSIWRCHMQAPLKYASDCLKIVNYIVNRVQCSSIETIQHMGLTVKTNHIWKSEFRREVATDHLYRINYRNYKRIS